MLLAVGLAALPGALWAVRAPDPAYAPLPDYDIRWGYATGTAFNHPGIAEEATLLREQRRAKGQARGAQRPRFRAENLGAVREAFGPGAKVNWSLTGTPRTLRRETGALTAPQPGAEPQAVAREFLRSHPAIFGLSEASVEALGIARQIESPRGKHITFRQTLDGVPVYRGDYKVSLSSDNAVVSTGGTLYPDLVVVAEAKLTAVEATQAAARYVGPLGAKPKPESETPSSAPPLSGQATAWVKVRTQGTREFAPVIVSSEAGPEQKTTLTASGVGGEILASRVVFPLTATVGRQAWLIRLMKTPMENYDLVVDAEDGTLLSRTNRTKFSVPQGLVFLTNPDAGAQVTRSFVGDPTASPNTFIDSTQSANQGNNAFPLLGVIDGTGANDFSFSFTNSYLNSGVQNFNLDDTDRTIQFTPNLAGGYDMDPNVPFFFPPAGGEITNWGTNLEGATPSDDGFSCFTPPFGFLFFGQSFSFACVGTNGFVTFDTGSALFVENILDLMGGPPRVMGLWADLNPGAGGQVGFYAVTARQFCLRWTKVPEFGTTNKNTFSICLYGQDDPSGLPAGTIRISYPQGRVAARHGLVGISPGGRPFTSSAPDSQKTVVFTDFSAPQSTVGPIGFARQFPGHNDVAVGATNIFWHLNQNGHDRLYAAGFTETAGNHQNDNFGRGGGDNDPIAILYSGSSGDPFGTNNAFFGTTPDGTCCSFAHFMLFTDPPFRRVDSAFDSDVVIHEHGHGVSTRFVTVLDNPQAGALGEGWSDWLALSYSGDPVMGEYVTGNNTTGIRRVAYDNTSPREFGQYSNLFGPFTLEQLGIAPQGKTKGVIFLPEVHDDGEIWASVLADIRTALLGSGWSTLDVETFILDSLAATPPDPTMLEARDALLAAFSGDPCLHLWPVFAARGLGNSASLNNIPVSGFFPGIEDPISGPGYSLSAFASFDRPGICGGSFDDTATPLHTANFDSASLGAKVADDWQVPRNRKGKRPGLWHVSNRRSTTGSQSFYFGKESMGTYEKKKRGEVKRSKGLLNSPVLDLSGAAHPVLEMDVFIESEDFWPWDTLWVRLSTDGGKTFPIQRAIMPWSTSDVFERMRIDLTPLAGQSKARIQLYFDSADNAFNAFEGVYIDNVVIRDYTEN